MKTLLEECHFTSTYLQLNSYVQMLPHILICDRSAAKSNHEKRHTVIRQVFFLIPYLFPTKPIFIKTLVSGSTVWWKNSYSIFWFQAEGMTENCNHKCFLMELIQELRSISPLLQLCNPTERKTDETQEDTDCFKHWIPQSLVRVTRKRNTWSPIHCTEDR